MMKHVHGAHDVVTIVVFAGRVPVKLPVGLIKRMLQAKHVAGLVRQVRRIMIVEIDKDTAATAPTVFHVRVEHGNDP